ncbi:MAG: metallophosphoesterase [bacterium]|nr:MAG: metallophosphoesterase [bacterium]
MNSERKKDASNFGYLRLLIVLLMGAIIPTISIASSWKWIAYGDTRSNDHYHREVLKSIMKNSRDYKFMINVGDVVEDGTVKAQWETWQKACDDILGGTEQDQIPPKYMAAPGNHDNTEKPNGLAHWNTYLSGQVHLYGNQGKFFVFDYQDARFIIMDSDKSSITGPQYTMLIYALKNNSKKWLFTVWHHPIFDFGEKKYEDFIHDKWGIPLYLNGCDIMFAGHAHYYVRSKKLELNGNINPPLDSLNGTVQVVTGNGGASMDIPIPEHDGNGYMVEAYTSKTTQFGYTELTVTEDTLYLKHFLRDGTVFDEESYTPNQKPEISFVNEFSFEEIAPQTFNLLQNYPNPFNPSTMIPFNLPVASHVMIDIYDITGQLVAAILNEHREAGMHQVGWECFDSCGNQLPAGVYLYKMRAGNYVKTNKMLIVK